MLKNRMRPSTDDSMLEMMLQSTAVSYVTSHVLTSYVAETVRCLPPASCLPFRMLEVHEQNQRIPNAIMLGILGIGKGSNCVYFLFQTTSPCIEVVARAWCVWMVAETRFAH